MPSRQQLLDTLNTVFGFPEFREGQEPAIVRLLAGKSVLTIFPTGAGKSLCYQLPALLMDGVALVISPLIALMKDQIDFLVAKGIPAARLDSSQEWPEVRRVEHDLHTGRLKLLYIAPERLANERFLQKLRRLKISMLAIDEVHCISEWGHNFRPDYMRLAHIARQLGIARVLGLTATATPAVAKDIAAAFDIEPDCVIQTGFHRPNLNLRITPCPLSQRRALLLERLRSMPRGPTIVYVTLQRTAEEIADFLANIGLPAKAYHAGMNGEDRHKVQDWFMHSAEAIVVATIAFGMGIDKRDIRYVYHYNVPKALEGYAQEIGRAGRDGLPSVCEMFPSAEDTIVLENFTYGDTPTPQAVSSLIDAVFSLGDVFDVSVYDLSSEHDIRLLVVETLLTYLELEGLIETTGPFYSVYRFKPKRSSQEILARFDDRRAEFLKSIFKHARKGRTWLTIDTQEVAQALGQPRSRIVTALSYLNEQGDLDLEVAGVRQGYRLKCRPGDIEGLKKTMAGRFLDREKRDVVRLQKVMNFANHAGCRTQYLLNYFGEKLAGDCRHCDWCEGARTRPIPAPRPRVLSETECNMIQMLRSEQHEALATPRQLTRFLCGLSSPMAARARLTTTHPSFASLAEVPFREVMAFVERAMKK